MDSPHTGSREIVYVETPILTLTIKDSSSGPVLIEGSDRDEVSMIKIVCDEDYDVLLSEKVAIPAARIEGRSISSEYYGKPLFFEQKNYEIIIESTGGHEIKFWHDNYNIRKNVSPVGRSGTILTGVINFRNDIGLSDLSIMVDGHSYLKLTLEVFPSKISYKNDYKAIVTDVTTEVYNLVFDFLKKTYSSFDISSGQQASMVEFFAIITKIYADMMRAADMVIQNPHHQLQTDHMVVPAHKAKRTDAKSLKWIEKHPEHAIRTEHEIRSDKILAVKKHVTYDTKENRLTKYMLERTAQRLVLFRNIYCRLDRQEDERILEQIDHMISGIQRRCNTGFMKEVDSAAGRTGMSLVFSMAPGYRELYRCYLMLQHGLAVTGSVFNLSVKDLAVLYEYWCFIKLNSLMRRRYELVSQDIIQVNGSGLFVSLVKGQRSRVKYRNPENGENIILSYNPKEIDSPTVTQRPDNVLSLEKKGVDYNYEYVFDAKYRIDPASPDSYYFNNISKTPGPKTEDINTMHRYRDAIVYSKEASPFERVMFGAYVLFPYHDEEEYKNHRFYKSIDQVNIGGLPFLPSATSLVTDMLDDLINDSAESAFERATLPRGIEEKLAKVNWRRRDVLIGTLRNKEQLDICLEHNFYHVPKDRIKPQNLPIRYVAIYQTKKMFGAEAHIEYYGEVLSSRIVKRSEITEIPKSSDEEYYRFEIGEWKKLTRPIEPKEIGFPIEYTNLFLIEHSSQVPELLIRSEEEYRLFAELKRRTEASVVNDNAQVVAFEVEDAKIHFEEGNIEIYKDGKLVNRSSVAAFAKKPSAVFRSMMKSIGAKND